MRRHWRNNWPFYAIMVPFIVVFSTLTYYVEWRSNQRDERDAARCALVDAYAVEMVGGWVGCVEVVAP